MIVFEYEAKALLAKHGVAVPAGGLYPGVVGEPSAAAPLVVKAQLEQGGRGKRGGVRVVRSVGELAAAVGQLRAGSAVLPAADTVLVEQFVPGRREIYLALIVDRDAGRPVLLAGPAGGVDIEEQAEGVSRLPLSILDERVPERVRAAVAAALGGAVDRSELDRLVDGLWACFREEECLLVEVNPCAVLADGSLVALDAKIVLDDNARRRYAPADRPDPRSRFEAECAAAGVSATEFGGDIAIIVSGAGLAMATLDLIIAMGGEPRCVVDLGYSTLQSEPDLRRVLDAVYGLGCRVVLVNGYLQMASCLPLAAALTAAADDRLDPPAIVARLAGNDAEQARRAVLAAGGLAAAGIAQACRMAVGQTARTRR